MHVALLTAPDATQYRKLMLHAYEFAADAFTSTEGNAPAIHLYTNAGFQSFGIEPEAILTPEGYKAKVHMWLPLRRNGAADLPFN